MPRDRTFAPENGSRLPTAKTLSSPRRKIATWSSPTSAQTPAPGTMSSSRQTLCKLRFLFFRSRRSDLAALLHKHDIAVGLVAVHEVAETPQDLRRLDRLLPFALIARDVPRHVGLELRADAERILADHLAQVVDAAFQVLQPHAGALQAVGGADVEH